MLFKVLLPGLLTTVVAVPTPEASGDMSLHHGHEEVIKFKRDTILEARDFELAGVHGVDLNESESPDTRELFKDY